VGKGETQTETHVRVRGVCIGVLACIVGCASIVRAGVHASVGVRGVMHARGCLCARQKRGIAPILRRWSSTDRAAASIVYKRCVSDRGEIILLR
jgi:hypothetical protein